MKEEEEEDPILSLSQAVSPKTGLGPSILTSTTYLDLSPDPSWSPGGQVPLRPALEAVADLGDSQARGHGGGSQRRRGRRETSPAGQALGSGKGLRVRGRTGNGFIGRITEGTQDTE